MLIVRSVQRVLTYTIAIWLGVGLASGCEPSASDTKTNWFRECDPASGCGDEGTCICGICTTICSAQSDCDAGTCGSELATSVVCQGQSEGTSSPERLCVASSDDPCFESDLPVNGPLGDAEPTACEQPGALLCQDFETAFPAAYSVWQSPDGRAQLQDCEVRSGAGALRFTGTDEGWTQARMRLPTPVSSGPLYVRFFARFEDSNILPSQLLLFELWDREEGLSPERTTIYLTKESNLEVFVGASMRTLTSDATTALSSSTWHCIRLSIDLSDTAGTVRVQVADASVIDETGFDTLPANPFVVAVLETLPEAESTGTRIDVTIDDLVIATEPIDCD